MRALIQRVSEAKVVANGELTGSIGPGYVILLGVAEQDTAEIAARMWHKIFQLRIFQDDEGKTNRSLSDVAGEVLIVSQFTLYADLRKGNRPSFIRAGSPAHSEALYNNFVQLAKADLGDVATGIFGADMQISLTNDGPFTIWLDSDIWNTPR